MLDIWDERLVARKRDEAWIRLFVARAAGNYGEASRHEKIVIRLIMVLKRFGRAS